MFYLYLYAHYKWKLHLTWKLVKVPNSDTAWTLNILATQKHASAVLTICLYQVLYFNIHEYYVQLWAPHYQKVIDKLEGVQRKSTEVLRRQEGLIYEERLNELNIYSLAK